MRFEVHRLPYAPVFLKAIDAPDEGYIIYAVSKDGEFPIGRARDVTDLNKYTDNLSGIIYDLAYEQGFKDGGNILLRLARRIGQKHK